MHLPLAAAADVAALAVEPASSLVGRRRHAVKVTRGPVRQLFTRYKPWPAILIPSVLTKFAAMERRKFKRIRATASIGYSVAGTVRPALTYDLSTRGCMVQSDAGLLEPGDKLELNFGGGLLVKGQVVWVKQRNAGIQFEAPLSAAMAKNILFSVVGTGLQHALQGGSVRLIANHLRPLLRWWRAKRVRIPYRAVRLDRHGTVRYPPKLEALILAVSAAPLILLASLIIR